jgi:6-pyruvoyltetrahydropterin/6-carboxytetrahydropterin synthase
MRIGITTKFDSSHFLRGYQGKCANMHGHTWHVQAEIEGQPTSPEGFVMDFAELKQKVAEVVAPLDHKCLNDLFDMNPTCEYIALYIKGRLLQLGLPVYSVRVQEGEGGWAIA